MNCYILEMIMKSHTHTRQPFTRFKEKYENKLNKENDQKIKAATSAAAAKKHTPHEQSE